MSAILGSVMLAVMMGATRGFRANMYDQQGVGESSEYDATQARFYLGYARAVFCSKASLKSWSCGKICRGVPVVPGSVRYLSCSDTRVQGFVAQLPMEAGDRGEGGPRCVGAFRGSARLKNWVADAVFHPTPWPNFRSKANNTCAGCAVHTGFSVVYDKLRDQLIDAIVDLKCHSIRFTGHSLGAAMATLATYDTRGIEGLHVETGYTYGSPRLGNGAFAKAFAKTAKEAGVEPAMWRIVHFHDPVARIPPHVLGPRHVGTEVFYSQDFKNYSVCPAAADRLENRTCSYATSIVGCIGNDQHVWYFNESMDHTSHEPDCDAENSA